MVSDAYQKGFDAFQAGEDAFASPYGPDEPEDHSWYRGYLHAKTEQGSKDARRLIDTAPPRRKRNDDQN